MGSKRRSAYSFLATLLQTVFRRSQPIYTNPDFLDRVDLHTHSASGLTPAKVLGVRYVAYRFHQCCTCTSCLHTHSACELIPTKLLAIGCFLFSFQLSQICLHNSVSTPTRPVLTPAMVMIVGCTYLPAIFAVVQVKEVV